MSGPNHRCDRCLAWHKFENFDRFLWPHGIGQCRLNPPRQHHDWPETAGDGGCIKGFTSKHVVDIDNEGRRRYG